MLDTFEVQRGERIDALADRWLRRGDDRPATEVWDAARDVVDALYAREAEQRASAWAADRAMVSDLERDGLL